MKIKAILFNTVAVQDILKNKKTTTRRLAKLKSRPNALFKEEGYKKCPYDIGDVLYVRETWQEYVRETWQEQLYNYALSYCYYADEELKNIRYIDTDDEPIKWRPSMLMPKDAARIFLKVVNVRMERLQDMTDSDAIEEGCLGIRCSCSKKSTICPKCNSTGWIETPKSEFINVWDATIRHRDLNRYSWQANPFVWVIEFKRTNKPINF